MEKVKSLLLIIFIVGVIGAVNTIIAQSRSGESIFTSISRVLGFYQEKPKEASRSLDYVPEKLKAEKHSQTVVPPATTNQNTSTGSQPSPTPTPTAIQTGPPIPRTKPFSTLGVKTKVESETPPIPATKPFWEKDEPTIGNFFKDIYDSFGF